MPESTDDHRGTSPCDEPDKPNGPISLSDYAAPILPAFDYRSSSNDAHQVYDSVKASRGSPQPRPFRGAKRRNTILNNGTKDLRVGNGTATTSDAPDFARSSPTKGSISAAPLRRQEETDYERHIEALRVLQARDATFFQGLTRDWTTKMPLGSRPTFLSHRSRIAVPLSSETRG
jgi:hypothetical protein